MTEKQRIEKLRNEMEVLQVAMARSSEDRIISECYDCPHCQSKDDHVKNCKNR